MPVMKDREYRNLTLLKVPGENREKLIDSDCYVEGYATTFDEPYVLWEYDGVKYYETISRTALDGADMSDVILQYDHEGRVLARVSNKTLGIKPDSAGLFVYADLSKSKASQELYEEIGAGLVTKMSWSFRIEEDAYNKTTRTRTIQKISKVYDVSAVSYPANDSTHIAARSYVDGVIDVERREALARQSRLLRIKILTEA